MFPKAGNKAQPEIVKAIARFRKLPDEVRAKVDSLWGWMLGESTPDFKHDMSDIDYVSSSKTTNRWCGNCARSYLSHGSGKDICDLAERDVKLEGWCNRWVAGDNNKNWKP